MDSDDHPQWADPALRCENFSPFALRVRRTALPLVEPFVRRAAMSGGRRLVIADFAMAGAAPAWHPSHRPAPRRAATTRNHAVWPRNAAVGDHELDQFGPVYLGDKTAPTTPEWRTSRQEAGTAPWAGNPPVPRPAHGENCPLAHCHLAAARGVERSVIAAAGRRGPAAGGQSCG